MKRHISLLLLCIAALSIPAFGQGESSGIAVGKTLEPWTEGCLDIHFINTVAGESIFLILPDGTQMLVDAAGSSQKTGPFGNAGFTNEGVRSRWDPTAENLDYGEFVSDHIRRCMQWTGNDVLDYALVTHFHCDHIGSVYDEPSKVTDAYRRQSWATVLENFKIGKMLDRGYPDYDYPFRDMRGVLDNLGNYCDALQWHMEHNGLVVERFRAGVGDQMVLRRNPEKYPDFQIRNLCVNGELWTGSGTQTRKMFPDREEISLTPTSQVGAKDFCPNENALSCMFRLSYGLFDYASFGDASYTGAGTYLWKDIETPVAKVCGEVEVFKADHHGSSSTNGADLKPGRNGICATAMFSLRPQCWVVCGYTDVHPRKTTFENIVERLPETDVYLLNSCPAVKGYAHYDERVKGSDGHVVVRVSPGGNSYRVYVISDNDGRMTVRSASDNYPCR